MAEGKWIPDVEADTPLSKAARHVLVLRFDVVRDRLPLAVNEADADVEYVHQLRVGTRRAGAALRIFGSLLPDRLQRRARKTLRRLRRAAGAARDWDVFLASLAERLTRVNARERRGLDLLIGYAHGQRACAQAGLVEAAEKHGERLPELIEEFADALEDSSDKRELRDAAVPTLTQLLLELEEAAGGDLSAYEQLHEVRILGKRFRYAMEVFASCFAADFRDKYYPAIEEMQELLGHANDSHVAAGHLRELRARLMRTQPERWRGFAPGIEALLRYHERRLPQQRRAFIRWWRAWHSSGGEKALITLLEHAD